MTPEIEIELRTLRQIKKMAEGVVEAWRHRLPADEMDENLDCLAYALELAEPFGIGTSIKAMA